LDVVADNAAAPCHHRLGKEHQLFNGSQATAPGRSRHSVYGNCRPILAGYLNELWTFNLIAFSIKLLFINLLSAN
jgi:hypothetical protein